MRRGEVAGRSRVDEFEEGAEGEEEGWPNEEKETQGREEEEGRVGIALLRQVSGLDTTNLAKLSIADFFF